MPDDTAVGDAAHNEELWEQHAAWWQHTFTGGADPEYEDQILPLVARHLDGARPCSTSAAARDRSRGTSPGRVPRCSASIPRPAKCARPAGGAADRAYAQARAEALPWRNGAFDAVVACLAFEHVDAIDVAIREVARVLEPDGRFVLLLGHPLLQAPGSGWVEDQTTGEHYWRIGAYLREHVEVDEVAPGVRLQVHPSSTQSLRARARPGRLARRRHGRARRRPPRCCETLWRFPEAATIPRIVLMRARCRP